MNIKVIVCYLILVVLGTLISCKKQPPKRNNEFDKTLYTIQKDGTLIHKKDLAVLDTLITLCEPTFHKKITRIDPCFKYTIRDKRITTLELVNLPTGIFFKFWEQIEKLNGLKTLILKAIKIKKLPNMGRMKGLQSLFLYHMVFEGTLEIPSHLSQLKALRISYTPINNIVFPKPSKINFLELSNNRMNRLNASYLYLDSLQKLNLYWNPIQDIQIDLNQFPHLKEVNLCGTATRDHIRKGLQKKYPHIKFNFCPEQIKVVFPDSVEAK